MMKLEHNDIEVSLAEYVKRKYGHISMGIDWDYMSGELNRIRGAGIHYRYELYDRSKDHNGKQWSRKDFNKRKEEILALTIEERRKRGGYLGTVTEKEFDKFTRGAYRRYFRSVELGIL